jgi:hypothetical protein
MRHYPDLDVARGHFAEVTQGDFERIAAFGPSLPIGDVALTESFLSPMN